MELLLTKNEIDWSAWSGHDYLLKAGVPQRPPKLTYVSSDATSVTVRVNPSLDSNGAPITAYKLFRDSGDNASDVNTAISAYDGSALTYQVAGLMKSDFMYATVKFKFLMFDSRMLTEQMKVTQAEYHSYDLDLKNNDRNGLK